MVVTLRHRRRKRLAVDTRTWADKVLALIVESSITIAATAGIVMLAAQARTLLHNSDFTLTLPTAGWFKGLEFGIAALIGAFLGRVSAQRRR